MIHYNNDNDDDKLVALLFDGHFYLALIALFIEHLLQAEHDII
jgi:hypothetical protein